MTSPNDPYHDEDAVDVDIGTLLNYGDEAPIAKTLKQMGNALRKGGFCSPKNEEGKMKETLSKMTDATQTDMPSLSDESNDETSNDVHEDEVSEKAQTREKSVTFGDLTFVEPLIVDEAPEIEVVEVTEKVEQPKENTSNNEQQKVNNTTMFFVPVVITIAAIAYSFKVCSIEFFMNQIVNRCIQAFSNVQPHLNMFQTEAESVTGISVHKLVLGFLGSLVFFISMTAYFASERRLKALLEFVWGVIVYSVVFTGIYFTYDFAETN